MHFFISFVWIILSGITCMAQRGDTLYKYLDNTLAFTTKANAVYNAVAVKSGDHWLLFSVYPDTGILLKAYFKDRGLRIKDGPFTLYHPNNIKALEGRYSNNIRQGVWKYWYEKGQRKDSGLVKNNQMVNTWFRWHENGQLQSIANYLPYDSIPDKPFVFADPQRKKDGLLEKDTLINSVHGQWIAYYDDGKKKDSGNYIKGIKEGPWINWYRNGIIESKGMYINGLQEGEWNYYYENGNNSTREQYVNNKITALECFDEAGNTTGSFCSILKPPVALVDRFTDFTTYMLDHIFWPKELEGKDVNGTLKAEYTISKEGKLISFTVLKSPHELLGKETERFFRSIEKWSPAMVHNRPMEFTVSIEIPFYR